MKQSEIKVGEIYEGHKPIGGGYPSRRLVKDVWGQPGSTLRSVSWVLEDSDHEGAQESGTCLLSSFARWAARHIPRDDTVPF